MIIRKFDIVILILTKFFRKNLELVNIYKTENYKLLLVANFAEVPFLLSRDFSELDLCLESEKLTLPFTKCRSLA